jgi:LysR family hydrogen peroxide-inducible transcriptional activator
LPRALKGFVRQYPRVELTVREDVTEHLLAAAVDGELDLALVALPVADDRLHVEPLGSEALYAALPAAHPLARRRRLAITDLAGERFILLNDMHCLGEQVLNFCRAHECQPQIACRSAQIATIQSLIALGQGVSLLPEMARRADRNKTVVYRTLAGRQPRRTLAAVWHRHHYHGPLAAYFLAGLRRWGLEMQQADA